MISGIDLTQTIDYTLKGDVDNPTIWKLGIIPVRILAKLSNIKDQMDMAFVILQVGIKGWDNFNGIEYKTIKETKYGVELDLVPMELIEKLSIQTIGELTNKIVEVNKLSVPEIKN